MIKYKMIILPAPAETEKSQSWNAQRKTIGKNMRSLLTRLPRRQFTQSLSKRSERYSFGEHNPQNSWQKWREQELLAGTPVNNHADPSPVPFAPALVIFWIVGMAVPAGWAYSKVPK